MRMRTSRHPRRSYNTEPEEPDYPDGYGYEEPEDEK